jgi:hypothetical protein
MCHRVFFAAGLLVLLIPLAGSGEGRGEKELLTGQITAYRRFDRAFSAASHVMNTDMYLFLTTVVIKASGRGVL